MDDLQTEKRNTGRLTLWKRTFADAYDSFSSNISGRILVAIALGATAMLLGAGGYIARSVNVAALFETKPIVFDTRMYPSAMPTSTFVAPPIEGKAAVVYDLAQKKVLYGKNEGKQLPLASLTKLMTAYVAHAALSSSTQVVIPQDRLASDGDPALVSGDVWNFNDLLGYTLMESSNDGARAIASVAGAALSGQSQEEEKTFITRMNAATQELGMTQTYFNNETGLDTSSQESGAYGSARDVALLLGYLLQDASDIFEDTSALTDTFISTTGTAYTAHNTNQRVGEIPALIASKTGYTDLAGGNLAVVFDAGVNHPVAVVVLGSSSDGRFNDTKALVDATLQYFTGKSME